MENTVYNAELHRCIYHEITRSKTLNIEPYLEALCMFPLLTETLINEAVSVLESLIKATKDKREQAFYSLLCEQYKAFSLDTELPFLSECSLLELAIALIYKDTDIEALTREALQSPKEQNFFMICTDFFEERLEYIENRLTEWSVYLEQLEQETGVKAVKYDSIRYENAKRKDTWVIELMEKKEKVKTEINKWNVQKTMINKAISICEDPRTSQKEKIKLLREI